MKIRGRKTGKWDAAYHALDHQRINRQAAKLRIRDIRREAWQVEQLIKKQLTATNTNPLGLAPLAASTIKRKGFTAPLSRTRRLATAIRMKPTKDGWMVMIDPSVTYKGGTSAEHVATIHIEGIGRPQRNFIEAAYNVAYQKFGNKVSEYALKVALGGI